MSQSITHQPPDSNFLTADKMAVDFKTSLQEAVRDIKGATSILQSVLQDSHLIQRQRGSSHVRSG